MKQKRIINLIAVMLFGQLAISQSKIALDIVTRSGYEYNVFNANASNMIFNGDVGERALKSGFFQYMGAGISWKIKSAHHEVSLNGKLRMEYFPKLPVANLFRPNLKLKYVLKANENHFLTLEGGYSKYRTNRIEDDTELLKPPRAYDRSSLLAKYNVNLFKGNKIYIQGKLIKTDYITEKSRVFYYQEYLLTMSIDQRLYNSKRQSHKLGIKANYSDRFYFDSTYEEDLDKEIIKERHWNYFSVSGEYTWNYKKKFKMTFGMNALERKDILQDKFGYRQYQPFVKISMKRKKIKLSFKSSAARRTYHTLEAFSNSGQPLTHEYLRASGAIELKLSKKVKITCKASAVKRIRNFPEGAKSYLSYDNAVVSLGLKFKII